MKLNSSVVLRRVLFFIVLGCIVLLILILAISALCITIKQVEHHIKLDSHHARNESLSKVKTMKKLFHPIQSSASNFARVLSSSLNKTKLSFSEIETKVAPNLFMALSTIPHLLEISYIKSDGLFFSYYNDNDQTLAVYSNTSFTLNRTRPTEEIAYNWYTQSVNDDTGKRYGEVISLNSKAVNANWHHGILNSSKGSASLARGWNKAHNLLFLYMATMDGRDMISLGFSMKALTKFLSNVDLHGGDLYLATENGEVLIQTGPPNTQMVLSNGTVLVQLMKSNGDLIGQVGKISCMPDGSPLRASNMNINGTKYKFYCFSLEIAGVKLVHVLDFPRRGLLDLIHTTIKLALMLLVLMLIVVVIFVLTFLCLFYKVKVEMFLRATLIKQMEATEQAERKSKNKSLAFASAIHDLCAPLEAISRLIQDNLNEVAPNSELAKNSVQMNTWTADLLKLLHSFLHTSKVEAKKLQLEEKEFNLGALLEDVVTMFYPDAIKKGVDVVLDPYDGSIIKLSLVKGDQGKLKQILHNLLNNAIKFTSEGHVIIRASVNKPTLESHMFASNVQQRSNSLEVVFEVEDTGVGIPKEKQKSVFENFFQVKDTTLGQGGTGLGLGIVRSLVHLMGGEIGIVEKKRGDKGTCFKFNVFLALCETVSITIAKEKENKLFNSHAPNLDQQVGLNMHPRSPTSKGSHIVLFIQGDERRQILKKFMESLGIKVKATDEWKEFYRILESINRKMHLCHLSSSGKSDLGSLSDCLSKSAFHKSDSEAWDGPLDSEDESNDIIPLQKKKNYQSGSSFVLIVIDVDVVPFNTMCRRMTEFRRDIDSSQRKVVWLDNMIDRLINSEEYRIAPDDYIMTKPFHGSCLYHVIGLLPEFADTSQGSLPKANMEITAQVTKFPVDSVPLKEHTPIGCESEIQEPGNPGGDKPLIGKKILVVEDNNVFRMVAKATLSKLGAIVELSANGEHALKKVCNALQDLNPRTEGTSRTIPYDCIFMDCEMPIMNGYQATEQIREQEKQYNIHIPIIALTAHAMDEEANKTKHAGMDFHLAKTLDEVKLLDAIRAIDSR